MSDLSPTRSLPIVTDRQIVQPYWRNFVFSIDDFSITKLQEEVKKHNFYFAKGVYDQIYFKTEKDRTLFLLKWA